MILRDGRQNSPLSAPRTEGHAGPHRGWPSRRGQHAAAARADSGWNQSGVPWLIWIIWQLQGTGTVPSWLAPDWAMGAAAKWPRV